MRFFFKCTKKVTTQYKTHVEAIDIQLKHKVDSAKKLYPAIFLIYLHPTRKNN